MKNSRFRQFATDKYFEHRDECKWYRIPCKFQSLESYISKNKWFLRKLWKELNNGS